MDNPVCPVSAPPERRLLLPGLLLLIAASLCGTGCATGGAPGERSAGSLVRRYFDDMVNRGNFQVADELIASDLVLHHPHITVTGLESYKQSMAAFHVAFPDLRFVVEDQVAEGDRVLARWVMTGTQRGRFQGQPPSGRKISVAGMSLFRVDRGRIREIWVNMDRFGFMQQLGMIPTPTQAPASNPNPNSNPPSQ